ncbi:MAG: hypothetical protein ABWY78_16515 [Microvirga sp.]
MLRRATPKVLLAAGFALGVALAACSTLPRTIVGLPDDSAWISLPLSDWLAEDRAEPEAVALCESCGAGMTVGIVRLSGPSAREAEAELQDPQRLVQALEARASRARPPGGRSARRVAVKSSARPIQAAGGAGFLLTLWRADGTKPAIQGAALGRRDAAGLTIVLVIGTDAGAVESLAARIAKDRLAS